LSQQLLGAVPSGCKGSFDLHGVSLLKSYKFWVLDIAICKTVSIIDGFLK
jgi:hypothetical protein